MFTGLGSSVRNYALMALVLSALLWLLFAWWYPLRLVPWAGYLLVCLIATLSVPIFYRMFGFTQADEISWLEERESSEHDELIAQLALNRGQLQRQRNEEGVRQCDRLESLLTDYHAVIDTRFRGKTHMPLEYLSAARQVQKHAVQNLTDVVAVGHSLSSISSHPGERTDDNRDRFDKHSDLYQQQGSRMENLLEENRKMFDALTETAVEVANIKSFNKYERIDTLARLVSLAEIASHSGSHS